MEHNVTKVLCHPDLGPFCVWHEEIAAYAMYFSNEANLPKPASLKIEHNGMTDEETLIWRPVVLVIGNPDEDVEVCGEYDETGEPV